VLQNCGAIGQTDGGRRCLPQNRGWAAYPHPMRAVVWSRSVWVTLSGWYVPSRNRAAVVLLHGASSTRSNVLDHALVLAGRGYGVLLYDARGHGRSGGRAMELGWYGDRDIAAAVDYLEKRNDVDPPRIAALGCRWAASRQSARWPPTLAFAPSLPKVQPIGCSPTRRGCRTSTASVVVCSRESTGSSTSTHNLTSDGRRSRVR